ncbi:hypothetical protein H312_01552, partial [Anncaliia algerae PRA339]
MKDKTKPNFPLTRIKRIMLDNEEIGKISPGTPVIVCKAMEMFLADIIKDCYSTAKKNKSSRITKENVQDTVSEKEHLGFLNLKNIE